MVSDTHHSYLRQVWWLHPGWLFAASVGGTMVAAYLQTKTTYALLGTPKYIRAEHVALALGAIFVFALGQRLAQETGRVPAATPLAGRRIWQRAFWLLVILTLVGYASWVASAVKNGFSLATLSEFLVTDDPDLAYEIKDEMFITIRWVTTSAQFAIAAVPLGMWLLFVIGERKVVWALGVLGLLATARALVVSERLALIELVVVGLVPVVRYCVLGRQVTPLTRLGWQLVPIVGVMTLLLTFGIFEYFRSWRYYRQEYDSLASFTVARVGAYYTTAHNNGALALETQGPHPLPYATFYRFWTIPGLARTALGYERLTGVDPDLQYDRMLDKYGSPEFNNEGGLFQPALDFGLAGFFFFWFGAGIVAGRLYRHFLVGTLAGLTLFPLMTLAILETPRVLYLSNTRAFPPLVALFVTLWLTQRLSSSTMVLDREFASS